ncbi:MAG: peptidoglycan editing factor PgeF, partial [Clostridia bacterium]|nr:peptidoglycan editing factor PgeF [Clostridia bacterium]
VHGAAVVYAAPGPWLAPEADALVTDSPVVVLGVLAADCAPIFLLDPRRRVAGLAHAGWRGTARGVVLRTLEVMAGRWGTNPADVVAVVGPCIGPCCYEVGEEVVEALSELLGSEVPVRRETGRRPRLDLRTANARQLVQAGVDPRRVVTVDLCTSCRADLFFSHRREGTAAGRMLALLQLKANGPTC